jgi:hypothetical protein
MEWNMTPLKTPNGKLTKTKVVFRIAKNIPMLLIGL